jgi:hypothetical protein
MGYRLHEYMPFNITQEVRKLQSQRTCSEMYGVGQRCVQKAAEDVCMVFPGL